jgi:hypothetical protein
LKVIFALLDPDSEYKSGYGSTGPIEYGSNPDPDPDPDPKPRFLLEKNVDQCEWDTSLYYLNFQTGLSISYVVALTSLKKTYYVPYLLL